jgi:hypothetical protein
VTAVHNLLGLASIGVSVAAIGAALWSVIAARRSDGRRDHRFAVDRAVLAVLLLLGAAGLAGMALLVSGAHPADPLHLVYGPVAILWMPVAIWIGAGGSAGGGSRLRRDVWTAGGGIVLFALGLRLLGTG